MLVFRIFSFVLNVLEEGIDFFKDFCDTVMEDGLEQGKAGYKWNQLGNQKIIQMRVNLLWQQIFIEY